MFSGVYRSERGLEEKARRLPPIQPQVNCAKSVGEWGGLRLKLRARLSERFH